MDFTRTAGVLISVLAFLFPPAVDAAEERIEMQSGLWEEASGEATISEKANGAKEITIEAENLVPDSVFTVWFANEDVAGEKKGVGDAQNSFRTDANGDAEFKATVTDEQLEKWQKILVGFHPAGDPANLENVHLALSGDLNEAG